MSTSTYVVAGMTCSGCAGRVRSAVGKVAGVTDVGVDPVTGQVTIASDGTLDDSKVRDAVKAAGYEVKD
ncbi:heavy-metal-associated domain-containing protein [Actinopolymorpha pittospori]|uniref:Copper chaperone CopZ n=1 Tax=Actinopolymorpha pittospori TaxID=648752 RepID=A0A927MRU7_9ACTN|nr:heavy metal-associated domain-containing protein [Actinopolymorpha pittospori]MBE1605721.1 copper chaperone CopZ [Actinopolymorpha pittospori]